MLAASFDDSFEGVWVIHSFHQILSKTGLTGLRNNQLQRVDQALYKMHYQCESLLKDCREVQAGVMSNWSVFAFFLIAICQPGLLIWVYDFNKDFPAPLILAPTTLAWVGLIFAQIYLWCKINEYYKKVIILGKTQAQYQVQDLNSLTNIQTGMNANTAQAFIQRKVLEAQKKAEEDKHVNHRAVKGRNTKQCSLYKRSDFVNRFIVGVMISLSFLYLGFFAKIYILPELLTFTYMAPVSILPFILMYGYELWRNF